VFDRGDFAVGNIWIPRDLRRRRNNNWNHAARDCSIVGNIDVVGNLSDLGAVDVFRDAGNVGIDGNVRLRFEQHCCVVEPNVNVTCHDKR
jgi:hypothetical protein